MPKTRPRQPAAEHSRSLYADSDSGGDTEREQTPKPQARTLSKKRLSERLYDPEADGSFSAEGSNGTGGRAPLKSVNINDDIAEKRRRRKSVKVTVVLDDEDAEAGPSNAAHLVDGAGGSAEGTRATALGRQKSQLLNVPQAPVINVPIDVMTSNFDQWMKMATDNVSARYLLLASLVIYAPSVLHQRGISISMYILVERSTDLSCRKSTPPIPGISHSSTTSMICLCCATTTIIPSTSSGPPARLMAASRSGRLVSTPSEQRQANS